MTPVGTGEGVYMSADAEQVADAERGSGIEAFLAHVAGQGGEEWTAADVSHPLAFACTASPPPSSSCSATRISGCA